MAIRRVNVMCSSVTQCLKLWSKWVGDSTRRCFNLNQKRTFYIPQNLFHHQDVIRLETQYWTLIDIPRQEKQETVPSYVMRACAIMEKTQKSGEGVKTSAKLAEEAAEKRERMERLEGERVVFCWIFCFYTKHFVYSYDHCTNRTREYTTHKWFISTAKEILGVAAFNQSAQGEWKK